MKQDKNKGYAILDTENQHIYGEIDGKDVFPTKKQLIQFIGKEIGRGNLPQNQHNLEIITTHRENHDGQKIEEIIKQLKQVKHQNIQINQEIIDDILDTS